MTVKEFFNGAEVGGYISIYEVIPGSDEKNAFFLEGYLEEIICMPELEPYLDYNIQQIYAKDKHWIWLDIYAEKISKGQTNKTFKKSKEALECLSVYYDPSPLVNWNKVYKKIRELMKEKAINKKQLANEMHMSDERVERAFKNRTPWPYRYIEEFEDLFGVKRGTILADCFVKQKVNNLMQKMVYNMIVDISVHIKPDKLDEFKQKYIEYMAALFTAPVKKSEIATDILIRASYENLPRDEFGEFFKD